METGELLKKWRLERGLTQQQLCEGICSRTTLASIERLNSKVSFDLLEQFLNKLNIDFLEFQFQRSKYHSSKKKQLYQQYKNEYYHDTLSLAKLEKHLVDWYEKTNDIYYIIILLTFLRMEVIKQEDVSLMEKNHTYISIFKKYLQNIETLSYFEISALANCLYLLDLDYIAFIINTVSSKITLAIEEMNERTITSYLILYFNAIEVFLTRKEVLSAQKVIQKIKQIPLNNPARIYYKIIYEYYVILTEIVQGRKQEENLQYILTTFGLFGYEEKAAILKNSAQKIINLYR